MAAMARNKFGDAPSVCIETSTFEGWNDLGRTFDAIVAASSWHWVEQSVGWPKARKVLRPGGWMALIGQVVIRVIGELEVYAETADLHERFAPGNPGWGHPPLEAEVRAIDTGWGPGIDPGALFGPTIVRFYAMVQHFDAGGFADHLRTLSMYRRLDAEVREPLLESIAERIRTHMHDQATRRYLAVMRFGQCSPLTHDMRATS